MMFRFWTAAPEAPFPSPAFPILKPVWLWPLLFPALLIPVSLWRREFAGLSLALLAGALPALAGGLDALGGERVHQLLVARAHRLLDLFTRDRDVDDCGGLVLRLRC